jgi:hypothetical protein
MTIRRSSTSTPHMGKWLNGNDRSGTDAPLPSLMEQGDGKAQGRAMRENAGCRNEHGTTIEGKPNEQKSGNAGANRTCNRREQLSEADLHSLLCTATPGRAVSPARIWPCGQSHYAPTRRHSKTFGLLQLLSYGQSFLTERRQFNTPRDEHYIEFPGDFTARSRRSGA